MIKPALHHVTFKTTRLKEMVDWGRKYYDTLKDWPTGYTLRA